MTGLIASATVPSQQRLLNLTYIRDPGPRGTRYYTAGRAFLAAADRFLPASGGSAFPVCPDMLHRWRHSSASRRRNWWPCPRPLGATPSGKSRSSWQRPPKRDPRRSWPLLRGHRPNGRHDRNPPRPSARATRREKGERPFNRREAPRRHAIERIQRHRREDLGTRTRPISAGEPAQCAAGTSVRSGAPLRVAILNPQRTSSCKGKGEAGSLGAREKA
jgi:hypothetical protein